MVMLQAGIFILFATAEGRQMVGRGSLAARSERPLAMPVARRASVCVCVCVVCQHFEVCAAQRTLVQCQVTPHTHAHIHTICAIVRVYTCVCVECILFHATTNDSRVRRVLHVYEPPVV